MPEGVMEQETEGKVPYLMVTATWRLTSVWAGGAEKLLKGWSTVQ